MPARNKIYTPILDAPNTQISTNYTSGTTLTVYNTTDFNVNDYILVERLGSAQAEIGQISAIPSSTSLTLVSGLNFPHNADTQIWRMDYNQFRVYRSVTGLGGTYILITTQNFQVDQPFNTYLDSSGTSAYSYKYTWFNSTTTVESSNDGEHAAGGFPFYALGSISRRVGKLYVDDVGEFIEFASISDWCNELLTRLNRAVTGTESALFVNYVTFTPGNNEFVDLTQYNIESILLLEYSTDGGVTYHNDTINPMDMRIKATNQSSLYSYKLIDQRLFIYNTMTSSSSNPDFPATYVVRCWNYTQPTLLALSSDLLPIVYRSFSDVFVDYCMMRANEQSRRFQESAAYYYNKLFKGTAEQDPSIKSIVESVQTRIAQGNQVMATTWSDSFSNW